jgi:cell fate regulator YaaT (PSP1 superfamily)
MGCSGCSSKSGGGCSSGGGACGTCHSKLPVFNWLSGVSDPKQDIVEVSFKNGRKGFYRNVNKLPLMSGDVVSVEGNPGYDIGIISLSGDIVRLQMRKKNVKKDSEHIKKIYRKASQADIEKWQIARGREFETMHKTRVIALDLGLEMKITDVEFQGDNTKATFYYTANSRVDFRELIKIMANEFKIRIEMKQIGARQESSRLGGIGACGRELCCSSWLTDFRTVNTSAARYQQLSLNPQKLAGQCGKLKCCLNFELDSYIDALQHFPNTNTALHTKAGKAYSMKVDIFAGKILYCLKEDLTTQWFELDIQSVKKIIGMNKRGEQPESLEDFAIAKEEENITSFENVVGQDSLTRFDTNKKQKRGRNNTRRDNQKGKYRKPAQRAKTNTNSKTSSENKSKEKPTNPKSSTRPKRENENKKRTTPSRPKPKTNASNKGSKPSNEQGGPKKNNRPKFNRRKPRNPRNNQNTNE